MKPIYSVHSLGIDAADPVAWVKIGMPFGTNAVLLPSYL